MAARADVSIMITAKDNYSEAIMKMQKTQTAFRKDLKAMQKDLDNLNKSKIQLKVDLTQTKKELAEAKKRFLELGDAESRAAYMAAEMNYDNVKANLDAVSKSIRSTQRDMDNLTGAMSKADARMGSSGGGGEGGVLSQLSKAGLFNMLSSAGGELAGTLVTSAAGEQIGNWITSIAGGAASGAALGSVVPGIGTAVGAAVGAGAGAIKAFTQQFSSKDDAFKSVVEDTYNDIKQTQAEALDNGSSLAANREASRMSFATLFGDEKEADGFIQNVTDFANKTPFMFDDLTSMSKVLKTYGYEVNELLPTMQKIGDAGAALGLDQSGMSAIATYLGRMKSTGKVTMEYLNPLLERGIPVWDYLAAASGKTNKEVQEMVSKGLVPGEKAAAALADYMGADFAGSMEKQAKTYAGLTSTLQGMQDEMDVAMGEGYNEQRKLGMQAEIDWLSGDSGDRMKEANRLVGEWQASLENEKERLLREALDDVMNSDEFAGADDINKGRMIEEARAKAQADYYQNDRYQRQLEADKELISKIRTEMADAYYDAGYSLGLEFDKGLIAARIDNSGLGGDNSVNWAAVSERTKRAMYGNRNKTAGRSSRRSRRAYGIDRVPYDGFSATLHEGERVLTAAQARAQDSAGGGQIIISGNQFMVREDADIDRIATELYHKIADAKSGYIGEVSLV